ncbi:HotDog domain-containing protein [Linnemannia elongata]|nr:hypothetical protein BGZ88_011044 [Linnemannia elongata]KAG0063946.1 hypothetical protein BGZ90_002454 [Linnemannia elongata]KAH7045075.1 HotDog domain-containing protein [Linnemannia elongata]KAK5821361.1 HotDog domain-containing protein [Linnemannia elongata]
MFNRGSVRLSRTLVTKVPVRSATITRSKQQCSFYATGSNTSSNSTASPIDVPKHTSAAVAATTNGNGSSGWLQKLTLMTASAAAGAFAYSKYNTASMEGLSGMPIGKMTPTILTEEEPDEVYKTKPTQEKLEEIKRSVLLEREMAELHLVAEYKDKVKTGEWKEANPYWYLTKNTTPHHLTAGTLRGENMLSVHPIKFERKDQKAIVLFLHLGRSLCGHDRIIHGGLLATLLDEATGMVALPNLPYHIGFTANLNLNYRKPVKADQFVMIKAEFERGEGRKGYTKASIHDLDGNTLVECTALFVSPKNPVTMVANYVKNSLGFTGSS